MTTAAAPAHVVRWIIDESPGALGEREIWVDEAALEAYVQGYADLTGNLLDAIIRFDGCPGLSTPAVYRITCRRWSHANGGRPYYVLTWPD